MCKNNQAKSDDNDAGRICNTWWNGWAGFNVYDEDGPLCPAFFHRSTFRRLKGGQRLDDCSPCPAGYFCPHPATVTPRVCGAGSYSVRLHVQHSPLWLCSLTEPQLVLLSCVSIHKSDCPIFSWSIFSTHGGIIFSLLTECTEHGEVKKFRDEWGK